MYYRWAETVQRCTNPQNSHFKYYGARGVSMWPAWRQSFAAYRDYIRDHLGPCPGPGFSIDRINNDGNYEPENLRWADTKTQRLNNRHVRLVTMNGITLCLADWGKKLGVHKDVIYTRLNKLGWPPERALTEPLRGSTS
jgi:hypothetical protein